MPWASFRFHEELSVFLPASQIGREVRVQFEGNQTVKHLFESLGVPHTEVGWVTAGGQPVDFGYIPQEGEIFSLYPAKEAPPEPRFLLDNHLGKLATYLRMLGFDALYRNDFQDQELVEILQGEARILLTRDRRLLMRKSVRAGYWVRSTTPEEQTREVVRRYHLAGEIRPFHRCLRCNSALQAIGKAAVLERLEPLTRKYYEEFYICPDCQRVYWKGSHYERMQALIGRIAAHSGLDGDHSPE